MPQPTIPCPPSDTGAEIFQSFSGIDELKSFLEAEGIDTSTFGSDGKSKPLGALLQELQTQRCFFKSCKCSSEQAGKPSFVRMVQPITIRLNWDGHFLVEDSQSMNEPFHYTRECRMMLAGEKDARNGGGLFESVLRIISSKLCIPLEELRKDGMLNYRNDKYFFEIETRESRAFPLIPSEYRVHHVQVDILEDALHLFKACGLPECTSFTTSDRSELGAIHRKWSWYAIASAMEANIQNVNLKSLLMENTRASRYQTESPAQLEASTFQALTKQDLPDAAKLESYLKLAGIDTARYGVEKAKPVSALFKEVENGETRIEWCEQTKMIRRAVQPVFVQLVWNGKVLVEHEQRFKDGRSRQRNMLLAEKMSPEDGSVAEAAFRGLREELNLRDDIEIVEAVRFVEKEYCCVAEHLQSSSYPNLPSVYCTHYCVLQLSEYGIEKLQGLGMLEPEFQTEESDGKVNCWCWMPLVQARKNVKGFPRLIKEPLQRAQWQRLSDVPSDIDLLKTLLLDGKVDVNSWGAYATASLESLANELKSGATHLERDQLTGTLRRVFESSAVQLKTFSEVSEEGNKKGRPRKPRRTSIRESPEVVACIGVDAPERGRAAFNQETGFWEITSLDTGSYPGLLSCHQTQFVHFFNEDSSPTSDDTIGPTLLTEKMSQRISGQSADFELSRKSDIPRQLGDLQANLKFRMVEGGQGDEAQTAADEVVSCFCDVLLIRNINPLTATYYCRFVVCLEWIDQAASQMPVGEVSEEHRNLLNIPEIALQNTLKTSLEVYSMPRVIDPGSGHVGCEVLYQALVQLELDMRLFPFDKQQLNLILGLRARRDRNRALFCPTSRGQSPNSDSERDRNAFSTCCHVDESIHLDEWRILGSHTVCDRPDGRARVQFRVTIGRAFKYYLVNVLGLLFLIASFGFAGFFLEEAYDRLRFGITILFAQTVFRLSVDSKLPKVAYATVFDQFAMACQILALSMLTGNMLVDLMAQGKLPLMHADSAEMVDQYLGLCMTAVWLAGNACFALQVALRRHRQQRGTLDQNDQTFSERGTQLKDLLDSISKKKRNPSITMTSSRAVSIETRVWLIHDIDPISAQYECKFSVHVEWIDEKAKGLPEGKLLTEADAAKLEFDIPKLDLYNKNELICEDGPIIFVTCAASGRTAMVLRYHARLQLRLNLRRFPFDRQRLPIRFVLPNLEDSDRAFVYKGNTLSHMAREMDEWTVQGEHVSTCIHDGRAHALLEIFIQRNSSYYVLSILLVLLCISSLMFTVFAVDGGNYKKTYVDQGKVLVPLMMALLSFKLLTSSGKIPKVPYATMFDQYMLASEACFFLISSTCTVGRAMGRDAGDFQLNAFVVLMAMWILFNCRLAFKACCSSDSDENYSVQQFESEPADNFLHDRDLLSSETLDTISCFKESSVVRLDLNVKQVHSLNPAAASFVCEFEAAVAWLADVSKLPDDKALTEAKAKELGLPKLAIQNALDSKFSFMNGEVSDASTGHIICNFKIRARVQMNTNLVHFPWDEQSLHVVLMADGPQDHDRRLVLHSHSSKSVLRTGEWCEIGSFATAALKDGISEVVFGVRIKRFSRYYVTSLVSLIVWSMFIFSVYSLGVDEFANRSKISVGVLLVQNVAKVAVAIKMPRVVVMTAYDQIALNSLVLNCAVSCSAAAFSGLWRTGSGLSFETLTWLDQLTGIMLFIVWLMMNVRTAMRVRRAILASRDRGGEDDKRLPDGLKHWEDCCSELVTAAQAEEALVLQSQAVDVEIVEIPQDNKPLFIGVKLCKIAGIDVSASTFDCTFHAFLEWSDQAAYGLIKGSRLSVARAKSLGICIPEIDLKQAISTSQDWSDLIVADQTNCWLACRVQFVARIYQQFRLQAFPFDIQNLQLDIQLGSSQNFYIEHSFLDMGNQTLDGWKLRDSAFRTCGELHGFPRPQQAKVFFMIEREVQYFLTHVFGIFMFITTMAFSFFVFDAAKPTNRLVAVLKLALMNQSFRFSVEHRLPKTRERTPFDVYVSSCQALCCLIMAAFVISALTSSMCDKKQFENVTLISLAVGWFVWNIVFILYAYNKKLHDFNRWSVIVPAGSQAGQFRPSLATMRMSMRHSLNWGPSKFDAPEDAQGTPEQLQLFKESRRSPNSTAVVSIATRIWLVRNVDLVTATFECKFRIFLEWFDENAIGLPKGKKAKLEVPELSITNAAQFEILDRSKSPEVVCSETGHLAAQILYSTTLKIDKQVHLFPFDCQWLAITISLKDDGTDKNRALLFQYCEVDKQLSLDEWFIYPKPAFCSISKKDAPSMQPTVMAGILIRRCARYYVANIMIILGLISSLAFSIYAIDVDFLWGRAEIFLCIFPLIVTFKVSAQGKLPRVSYSTKFDRFVTACQCLFLAIVMGSMFASLCINIPIWLSPCSATSDTKVIDTIRLGEQVFFGILLLVWVAWNSGFTWGAYKAQRMEPVAALGKKLRIELQDMDEVRNGGAGVRQFMDQV
eukprot:TRINITY_DN28684_c0_g1_i1.p1 TRINITY_DN28684_c0_g1~~TRINITY_DN28684_c0_g1_i1.p1  ORF type:complete len:2474 (-),score=444.16 TRINITY_DN28684_c0_g1_i1:69-7490(-)